MQGLPQDLRRRGERGPHAGGLDLAPSRSARPRSRAASGWRRLSTTCSRWSRPDPAAPREPWFTTFIERRVVEPRRSSRDGHRPVATSGSGSSTADPPPRRVACACIGRQGRGEMALMDPLAPLERALAHARTWLDSLGERPVRPAASLESLQAAFGGELPERGEDPAQVLDLLARAGEPGLVATRRATLLRVRHRREPAGGARRGLAHLGLGPERRPLRRLAHGGGAGGDRRPMAERPLRAPGGRGGRLRHRRADGELHRPRRRATCAAGPGRLERLRAGAVRRPGAPRRRRRGGPRHGAPRPALPRPRTGAGEAGDGPTDRAGWIRRRSRRCSPGARDRR